MNFLRSGRWVLAVALALTTCKPEPTPIEPRSPESSEPVVVAQPQPLEFAWKHEFEVDMDAGTFAVVPFGAGLWKSADDSAPAYVYGRLDPAVVKVVAHGGEFVEVQLDWENSRTTPHCTNAPLLDLGLRVFVRERELVDVTTSSAIVDFGDGTGINVPPGCLGRFVRRPEIRSDG